MKKLFKTFLVTGLLFCGMHVSAQQTNPFITETSPPIPVLINSEGAVHVSVIDGNVNGKYAFSLLFENTGDAAITFNWSLLSADGKMVGETHTTSMPAHSTLDYSNGKDLLFPVVFVLPEGEKYTDYKVEIKY
jgi:hypothetical protein